MIGKFRRSWRNAAKPENQSWEARPPLAREALLPADISFSTGIQHQPEAYLKKKINPRISLLIAAFTLGFAPALVGCEDEKGPLAEEVCSKMDECKSFNIGTDKNDCVMTATSDLYDKAKLTKCKECMNKTTCEMISGEGGDVCAGDCV